MTDVKVQERKCRIPGSSKASNKPPAHEKRTTVRATQSDSALRATAAACATSHARASSERGLGLIEERWEGGDGASARSSAFYSCSEARSSVWSAVSAAFGAFGQPAGEGAVEELRREFAGEAADEQKVAGAF